MSSTLPSCDILGRGIRLMSGTDIFDVRSIINNSPKNIIVNLKEGSRTTQIPGNSTNFRIPENVSMSRLGAETVVKELITESGSSMADKLQANASLSASYAGVTAEVDAKYSYESSLELSSMYGLWSMDQKNYSVYIRGDSGTYDNLSGDFIQAASRLPNWEKDDSAIQVTFQRFFATWGTHVIKECYRGTRFQLRIEKENASRESKENFSIQIKAGYKDIVSGSAGVDKSKEEKGYLNKCRVSCYVLGGDPSAAADLARDSQNKDRFTAWTQSRKDGATDAVINIRVEEIPSLLERSPNQAHQNIGRKLSEALAYFERKITLKALLAIDILRWSPGSGEFSPVDARLWFNVKGPGLRVELGEHRESCTIHERTATSFVLNYKMENKIFDGIQRGSIKNWKDVARSELSISGPASSSFILELTTGCGGMQLRSPPESGDILRITKPDGREYVTGKVRIPSLTTTGQYTAN